MSCNFTVLSALLAGLILLAAVSQNAAAQVPIHPAPGTGTAPGAKHPRQEPCWEVAGVSKAAMQQRRTVARQARQEIEAVCSNSSLSIEQKRQQMQQIRERERQEIDGIITPAQREAMHTCQEGRAGTHGGGHGGGRGGPCGEMTMGSKANPQHHPLADEEDEAPPDKSAKPN